MLFRVYWLQVSSIIISDTKKLFDKITQFRRFFLDPSMKLLNLSRVSLSHFPSWEGTVKTIMNNFLNSIILTLCVPQFAFGS